MSFPELCVLLVVAMVVLGPKDLPRYLRKAGQMAGKLRRLAFEMREKSGIDELLRTEGIDRDIAEIRRLTRGEVGGVLAAVRSTAEAMRLGSTPAAVAAATAAITAPAPLPTALPAAPGSPSPVGAPAGAVAADSPSAASAYAAAPSPYAGLGAYAGAGSPADAASSLQREYPSEGADAYGALPDTAPVYDGAFPASPLAENPLYARGDDAGEGPIGTPPDESAPARAAAGTAE